MNKKLRELLDKINAKKNEVRQLAESGELDKAKAAKDELIKLQEQFDISKDLYDDEKDGILDDAKDGKAKEADGGEKVTPADRARAFVNGIVSALTGKKLSKRDGQILDSMNEGEPVNGESDGGFTVPEDIRTSIIELRRSQDNLEQHINVERVSTLSGSRVIELDADTTPWSDVDEGDDMTTENTPKFKKILYKVIKHGGILEVTRELLADTAENILAYLRKWIAKKSRATRNAAIIGVLEGIAAEQTAVPIADLDDLKEVFNVELDASLAEGSVVLTNQSGYNWLDKLKDGNDRYLIQPDPMNKNKNMLFGKYEIIRVSNKLLASVEVKNAQTQAVTGYKHPVFCGSLKDAVTLFDREYMSIELSSEAGDLWKKDKTGVKVRDRFVVEPVDTAAVVFGEITESV